MLLKNLLRPDKKTASRTLLVASPLCKSICSCIKRKNDYPLPFCRNSATASTEQRYATVIICNHNVVFAAFYEHANPDKAVEMSAYMRDLFSYLGIQKPLRAKLQREFFKAAKKEQEVRWEFIDECWKKPEREFQYLALDYLRTVVPLLGAEDIPRLRELAINKSWWDSVDALDQTVGDIALRYPEANETLLAWSTDENLWLRRIAIDHQLGRKDKTDTKLLKKIIINNLGEDEFFINKAIGWALREYSKTDPEWVRIFVEKYGEMMAPLSIREASKYI